jgi:hypothetical protein
MRFWPATLIALIAFVSYSKVAAAEQAPEWLQPAPILGDSDHASEGVAPDRPIPRDSKLMIDPWHVYGPPVMDYPGWVPTVGAFTGGPGISFGIDFGVGHSGGFQWGWHDSRCNPHGCG